METKRQTKWAAIAEKIKSGKTELLGVNSAGKITWSGQEVPLIMLALLPEDLQATARAIADQRQAEATAKSQAYAEQLRREREERDAYCAAHRDEPRWGLIGYYMEELTGPRWTLGQIEQWVNWARYLRLRYLAHGQIGVAYYPSESTEPAYREDLSPRFEDPCGPVPHPTTFRQFVADLEEYLRQEHVPSIDERLDEVTG